MMWLFVQLRALYEALAPALYWPGVQWKAHLVSLAVSHYLFDSYLKYRQHHVLKRSSSCPDTLRNILSKNEYRQKQKQRQIQLLQEFIDSSYKLFIRILLLSSNSLPRLWTGLRLRQNDYSISDEDVAFYERVSCLQFTACTITIWSILNFPLNYFNKTRSEPIAAEVVTNAELEETPKSKIKAGMKWLNKNLISKLFLYTFWHYMLWTYTLYMQDYGEVLIFQALFDLTVITFLFIVIYFGFIQPLLPAKLLQCTPLEDVKTKSAIEEMAKKLKFPLKNIYVQPTTGTRIPPPDVMIWGFLWRRNVAITQLLVDELTTEEIVATVMHHFTHRKYNPIQPSVSILFLDISTSILNLIFFINWLELCQSFGFDDDSIWPAQHPVMVIMLLYGGVNEPVEAMVKMIRNAINKATEIRADNITTHYSHGHLLARSLIKLKKAKELEKTPPIIGRSNMLKMEGTRGPVNMLEMDWMYDIFCGDGHLSFGERLGALGWVGDEILVDERRERDGKGEGMVKSL